MKKGFFLLLMGFSSLLYSQGFKLSKLLKDKLRLESRIQDNSNQINRGNGNDRRTLSLINRKLNIKLFDQLDNQISDQEKTNSQNLYAFIASKIKPDLFNEIDKLKQLIEDQKIDFNLGISNLNGFEWQKPMGLVHLYAKRTITQSNKHARLPWQVEDSYIIEVDAKTYLKKLANLDLIEIIETDLEAFANLKFHRKMSFIHFHVDNESAIESKLNDFLIPFLHYQDLSHISTEEFSVSDHFVFNAKASASMTWQPYFSTSAKLSVSLETLRNSNLRFLNNKFILENKSSRNTSFEFSMQARLELFKLLKLTLIDLGYQSKTEMAKTEVYKFTKDQLAQNIGALSVLNFLNFDSISFLSKKRLQPYQDFKVKESSRTNGYFFDVLGWKGEKSSSQNYVEVTRNNKKHLFAKYTESKSKYKKTFLGTFTSAIEQSFPIFKLFKYYKKYHKQNLTLLMDSNDSSYYALTIELENYLRIKDSEDLEDVFEQLRAFTNLSTQIRTLPFSQSVNNYSKVHHQIDIQSEEITSLLVDPTNKVKNKIALFCNVLPKCYEHMIDKFEKLKENFYKNKNIAKDLLSFYKQLLKESKSTSYFLRFFDPTSIKSAGSYSARIGSKTLSGQLGFQTFKQEPNRLERYFSP